MSDLVLLSRAQMRRIEPHFPRSRGLDSKPNHFWCGSGLM